MSGIPTEQLDRDIRELRRDFSDFRIGVTRQLAEIVSSLGFIRRCTLIAIPLVVSAMVSALWMGYHAIHRLDGIEAAIVTLQRDTTDLRADAKARDERLIRLLERIAGKGEARAPAGDEPKPKSE